MVVFLRTAEYSVEYVPYSQSTVGKVKIIMVIGSGLRDGYLSTEEIRVMVRKSLDTVALDGKRVLVLIPDNTRTMPMPFMFDLLEEFLSRSPGNPPTFG
jgi:hypothetical protein